MSFINYLFLIIIIFNQQIKSIHLINKKILLVRFYSEDGLNEIINLETNKYYLIDILVNDLNKNDRIYLIYRDGKLGDKILIDKNRDIEIDLSTKSIIENRLSNFKLINYFISIFNLSSELSKSINFFYSSIKFNENQAGEFAFCVTEYEDELICKHQGNEELINFTVNHTEINLIFAISITLFALFIGALTSGLTLGIMSLDKHELQVLINAGNKEEQSAAKAIYPLRKKGNFLLCTFVIANTLAESLFNYMINFWVDGILVVIISAVSIVIFAQILPLAISTRYGLELGSKTIYLTYFFIIITLPVSYPLSYLLDKCLGEETPTVYDKERLIEYIKLTKPINQFEPDQLDMITGVVYLRDKTVAQAMTKLNNVYMLSIETFLTNSVVQQIFKKGFSRVPVYKDRRDRIVSILFLKDLLLLNKPMTVKDLIQKTNHYLVFTNENEKIKHILNYMKKGKTHMVIVKRTPESLNATGIITLEDIIEEILQTEINDEADIQKNQF